MRMLVLIEPQLLACGSFSGSLLGSGFVQIATKVKLKNAVAVKMLLVLALFSSVSVARRESLLPSMLTFYYPIASSSAVLLNRRLLQLHCVLLQS